VKILLAGRTGQVGAELERQLAPSHELVALDRAALDLADPDAIRRCVRETKPQAILNAAAYTAVDRAETEEELARRVNGIAPGVLAEEAKRLGALLVHYSTDYVFDGEKRSPYLEDDPVNPLSAYGRSKLEGERAVRASGCRHLILRTAWVYESRGRNFLLTILRLAKERGELRIVGDQRGSPTAARDIAAATGKLIRTDEPSGICHLTSSGETSWYGFANEILRLAGNERVRVTEITTAEYPTPAKRPRYSVLSNEKLRRVYGIVLPDWRETLEKVCREVKFA
jgi:dTDP-4-dehydrorhamnose reductase